MASMVNDPPARLPSQLLPSTNTVAIVVMDPLQGVTDVQEFIVQLCMLATSLPASEVQAVDMNHYASSRLVRVTFYDVRNAMRLLKFLEEDSRFSVVMELKNGTNRSVVVPRAQSVDLLIDKFSAFGEIEKVWLGDDFLVVDFFDSRSPSRIVEHLNNQTNQTY